MNNYSAVFEFDMRKGTYIVRFDKVGRPDFATVSCERVKIEVGFLRARFS